MLITNNFNQDPFSPFPVKFTIEDLLPWTKVEPAAGYCNNHFTSHKSSLYMGIGIIFKTIMLVLAGFHRKLILQKLATGP